MDAERQPDSYLSQNNLGVEMFRSGNRSEAKPYFEKALELRPGWGIAANNLGAVYEFQGDLQMAEGYYKKAVEDSYFLGFENYAMILFKLNRREDLKNFLVTKALRDFPNNPKLRALATSLSE